LNNDIDVSDDSSSVIIRKKACTMLIKSRKSRNFDKSGNLKGNKTLAPKTRTLSPLTDMYTKFKGAAKKRTAKSRRHKSFTDGMRKSNKMTKIFVISDKMVESLIKQEKCPEISIEKDYLETDLQKKIVDKYKCGICAKFPYKP